MEIVLGLIVLVVVVSLALCVDPFTNPINWYLVGAFYAFSFLLEREELWAKAMLKVLKQAIWALLILFFILLAINLLFSRVEVAAPLHSNELFFLKLSNALTEVFEWPAYLLVLLGLVLLGVLVEQWHAVSWWLTYKERVTRAWSILAFVTSFSFFTNEGVIQPKGEAALLRVTTTFVGERKQEQAVVGEYLLIRAFTENLRRGDPRQRHFLISAIKTIASLPSLSVQAKREVAQALADECIGIRSAAAAEESSELLTAARTQVMDEIAAGQPGQSMLKQHQQLLETKPHVLEARKAFKEAIEETVSAGRSGTVELLTSFFNRLIDHYSPALGEFAKQATSKAGELYFAKYADRHVAQITTATDAVLQRLLQTPDALPKTIVRRVLHRLAVERPLRLAEEAYQAAKAFEAGGGEALAFEAETKAAEAQRLITVFQPKAARSVEEAAAAVVEAERTLTNAKQAAQATQELILSRNAARTADVTQEVAAAIRAAEAAKQALAAAQAAQKAAQAVRAADEALTVIRNARNARSLIRVIRAVTPL